MYDVKSLPYILLGFLATTDGQDFGAAMATVTFQPGETRACARFDIVDDDVVETPGEEDFTVSIVDTTPDVDTTRQPSTTVTITDDDCKYSKLRRT